MKLLDKIARKYKHQNSKYINWKRAFSEHPEWLKVVPKHSREYYASHRRAQEPKKRRERVMRTIAWRKRQVGYVQARALPHKAQEIAKVLRHRYGITYRDAVAQGLALLLASLKQQQFPDGVHSIPKYDGPHPLQTLCASPPSCISAEGFVTRIHDQENA
jgi:hypothetical protein